jgi:hypothetical protein
MTRFKATLQEGSIHFVTELMPEEENIGPAVSLVAKK